MVNKKYSFFIIIITLFLWFLIFFIIPFETEISFSGQTMGTTYEVKISQNLSDYHQNIISKDIDSILPPEEELRGVLENLKIFQKKLYEKWGQI